MHDGSLPLIGVNTLLPEDHDGDIVTEIELIRSAEGEKGQQIENVQRSQQLRNSAVLPQLKEDEPEGVAPAPGLAYLQAAARERRNVSAGLMEAVRNHSLGQIGHALYDVGGEFRRNM